MANRKPAGNALHLGDNLEVLRGRTEAGKPRFADESVDLIYLDPPFNSARDYDAPPAGESGDSTGARVKAFGDTWRWDLSAADSCRLAEELDPSVADCLGGLRRFLRESDTMAYLAMMAPRLIESRRVLKPTGSIYLHCDSTAGHYLKVLMDAVFGAKNFRNEIVWHYYNKLHDRRKRLFPRATDSIFFYAKDADAPFAFRQLKETRERPVRQLVRKKAGGRIVNARDEEGRLLYRTSVERTSDNVWRIPCLQPAARERLGYPTQKPEALLERIVTASSEEGQVVLDPFCGCGTTLVVAQRLNRRWIGIDASPVAIETAERRLRAEFGVGFGSPSESSLAFDCRDESPSHRGPT